MNKYIYIFSNIIIHKYEHAYIHTYTYIHTYIHTFIHTFIHIHTFVWCMFPSRNVCMFLCMYGCLFIRLYVCTFVCRYVCMYVSIYTNIHMSLHINCYCIYLLFCSKCLYVCMVCWWDFANRTPLFCFMFIQEQQLLSAASRRDMATVRRLLEEDHNLVRFKDQVRKTE